jgi:hypothetical protein
VKQRVSRMPYAPKWEHMKGRERERERERRGRKNMD